MDKSTYKILGCHPTGLDYVFDIPKGCREEGETDLDCAIRELGEETGLEIEHPERIFDCGVFPYTDEKDIHPFIYVIDDLPKYLPKLKCGSLIDKGSRLGRPEMDGYELFDSTSHFYKRLSGVMEICLEKYRKR